MEQLNKTKQDNKALKKAYRKKVQQNQVWVAKASQQNQGSMTKVKTPTKDMGTKPMKIEKGPSKKQPEDENKTTQAKVKAISASHIAEFEADSDS